MRRRRALSLLVPSSVIAPSRLLLSVAFMAAGCGSGAAQGPVTPPAPQSEVPQAASTSTDKATATPAGKPEHDPVAVGMTAEGVTKLCEDHLALAQEHLNAIKALKGKPAAALTWANTVGQFDDALLEINNGGEFPYLMSVAHPEASVREAAKKCEPKTDTLTTAMWLDGGVAEVLKAYAQKGEKLEGERARLFSDVLRDFRRNGLELPADKQARLRELNAEITRIGQDFMSNLASATASIQVAPKSLEGLPKEYVEKHAPRSDGKVEITTDYPDFFPFVTYSKDRKSALELWKLFTNKGGDANVKLLEKLLALRAEKAKLLGYKSWADYAIEPRMAKTSGAVREFLEKVRAALKEPATAEMAELMKKHVKLGGKKTDKLAPSERYYLEDQVRKEKYSFDSQALSAYLEIGAVKKGLLDITSRMYGLTYQQVPAKAWHADVEAYEVLDAKSGEVIGKFYLDLYSRPDKYKHAAMFTMRTAKRLDDGRWQTPIAALECNFPKPVPPAKGEAAAAPALMSHEDVVTFFHEFGHVLHDMLTRSELAAFSGTAAVRDFVEAPSQMFEEWAWSREVLDLFARHHQTGAKIPEDMFQAMTRARSFGRALGTQRQLFLALLDQELHSRDPVGDSTKVVEEVQRSTDSFEYVKGTHFQSSFGHLIGYDAGYYGYQWALSLSRDVLTRFRKEGLLNPTTARSWRDEVLSRGGGTDEQEMVRRFLGREPSPDAYIGYLQGKD
ncbi:M3 family metallopeptidase [Chondromyces apiculatus]|uniref:Thimet oligopeptidase n=1 Tax=Chondromyces apiculatus DSM 436 TaxID=1192034 RepID=A0A017TFG4_9BACT|nr:M3 family metallopeptidase [Chondromyces apiculatus]EYF07361.1 Thimet oligopeptidase [Chondromyces apiculatus DSM 436]